MNEMCSTCMDNTYRKDTSLSVCILEPVRWTLKHCLIGDFELVNRDKSKLLIFRLLMAKN